MKKNQMEVLIHSNGYEKGADLLSFSSSELSSSENGRQTNLDTLACGLAIVDDIWNNGVAKDSDPVGNPPGDGTENGYVPVVHNQETPGWHSNDSEKDMGSLNDEIRSTLGPMLSENLDEFNPRSEENVKKYETPSSSISGLIEPDRYTYTDKNIVECEMPPQLDVPSSDHVVKDICVDTGMSPQPQERILLESIEDNHGALITPQHFNGDPDTGVIFPDQSEGSTVEDMKKIPSNYCSNWEKFDSMELDESTKFFPEENTGENSSTLFCASIVPKRDEQIIDSPDTDSIADVVSEEASSLSSTRVSGEFMMQDSLLNSLKQEGDRIVQQSNEVPTMDTILESLAVMFNSKDSKKEDQMSKFAYNSKVEGGTITFDFNALKPEVPNSSCEEDAMNTVVLANEDSKDQSASNVEMNAKKDVVDSVIIQRQPQVQSANGESSFSMMEPVSGLITYSGQITYAGSTSIRSDSSTTSTRSFAFPVLQSEWNSSPVRMHKADPRRRRRRNPWNNILCCRF